MLILTRKLNESINISDNITITILEIDRGQVRLGIEAPKDVAIFRNEIYEQIIEQNKKAINSKKSDLLRFTKNV